MNHKNTFSLSKKFKTIMNIYGKRYLDRCPSIYFCGFAYVVENINDSYGEDEKWLVCIRLYNFFMIDG